MLLAASCYTHAMSEFIQSNGRLTEAGVRKIHELRASGLTYGQIEKAVGLKSTGTVYQVCKGITHRDLHPAKP